MILGSDGTITMQIRSKMPYTCAFTEEVLRFRTLGPMSVAHATTEDAVLENYTIPKGTIVRKKLISQSASKMLIANILRVKDGWRRFKTGVGNLQGIAGHIARMIFSASRIYVSCVKSKKKDPLKIQCRAKKKVNTRVMTKKVFWEFQNS